MNNKKLRIAAIAGDGIGLEVLPEGVRVVKAAPRNTGWSWNSTILNGPAAITTWSTAR